MFNKRYSVTTDNDGVQWRVDTNDGDVKMVKLNDPNFVHERVPLPTIQWGNVNVDILGVVGAGLILLITVLIGLLIGSAL